MSGYIDVGTPGVFLLRRRELLAVALGGIAAVGVIAEPPVSCSRHTGDFGADFSDEFDVSTMTCRVGTSDSSPSFTVRMD